MTTKKIGPVAPGSAHRVVGDHKGAVLPPKPAKVPMPPVAPTRGSRPADPPKPSKSK
jgi:hypothetical protein